jgi:hypothetical protein
VTRGNVTGTTPRRAFLTGTRLHRNLIEPRLTLCLCVMSEGKTFRKEGGGGCLRRAFCRNLQGIVTPCIDQCSRNMQIWWYFVQGEHKKRY